MFTRRDVFRAAGVGAVVAAVPKLAASALAADEKMPFTLPPLPYAVDFLEPAIDPETMTIHHDKHHKTYVDNLNKAVAGTPLASKSIDEIVTNLAAVPETIRKAVQNNGGGHWNHTFFWNVMTKPGTAPTGDLAAAIDASFGSLDAFKKAFVTAAGAQFGSGWAWLVPGKDKPLAIVTTPNQDNPLMTGGPKPVLGVDVWEHAYYLRYKNLRPKYVESWFAVVNWDAVGANYAAAKKG